MLEYSGFLKLYFFYTFLYVLKLRQSPRGAAIILPHIILVPLSLFLTIFQILRIIQGVYVQGSWAISKKYINSMISTVFDREAGKVAGIICSK